MGSVKDLEIIQEPTIEKTGIGRFIFSDRYSVFDWGQMPDLLTNKGKALCLIGAYYFEKLAQAGIKTHYRGLIENNKLKSLNELTAPVNILEFDLIRIIKPEYINGRYDYSAYQNEKKCFFIPLEIIYRNQLPAGASIFKRLKNAQISYQDLGLDNMPEPGQKLVSPILDVSSKLESSDRYLNWRQAQDISFLSDSEIAALKNIVLKINEIITQEINKLDLVHEDGKLEFGFDENRQIMVVDILGTPDECRFTYQEIPVSKEIARIYYRETNWYQQIEWAKKIEPINWKNHISIQPPALPDKLYQIISILYQSFCNELTARKWFSTPPLKDILSELKEILK